MPRGRPPSAKTLVDRQLGRNRQDVIIPAGDTFVVPNHSGDHSEGRVDSTPVVDLDIPNKKYVDDSIAAIPGGGDVSAAVNLTANTIVQGDDGAKGVKTSTATVAQIASNVSHSTGDGSDHADVALNTTHRGLSNNPHAVALDQIQDPTGDTEFSLGSNTIKWQFSNPASDGFVIESIGAFSGDLLHVHQHTGNPGVVHLVHLEAVDVDVLPLCAVHATAKQLRLSNVNNSIFADFTVDSSHNLTIDPSSTGKIIINSVLDVQGNITLTGTVDGVDIATDVGANTTHRGSDGSDHSKVTANETAIGLNTTHRGSAGGTDHSDVNTNNAKVTNVTTNLSAGTRTATTIKVDSSDGTDATLVEADTTNAGILGSDKWDEIVANSLKTSFSKTNVKGTINHGGTAGTGRPSGFDSV